MNPRTVARKTKETDIRLELAPGGSGPTEIRTPIGFLDHMLDTIARHAHLALKVAATGDTHIDFHHT
ncbi:MAG TPA: imidazoleglycerol-phosphate dehydratase, partial [Thermoanaerobaculia bacterium]